MLQQDSLLRRIAIACGVFVNAGLLALIFGCGQNPELIGVGGMPIHASKILLDDDESEKPTFPDPNDLIKDWPKPDFALFVSGRLHGYIEPCGCTSLSIQKGGLMRRHTLQKMLIDRGWDVVSIDAGNQIRRFGQQPVIKLRHTYESLIKTMDYQAIGFGIDDLKTAPIDLIQIIANLVDDKNNPFVSANINVMDVDMQNLYRVIERNGKRIAITHVIGDEHLPAIQDNDELSVLTADEALKKVVPQISNEKCDLNILMVQASLDNCRALAKKFPVFDLVITSGGSGDPTLMPEVIDTGTKMTQMIQVGAKGNYAGIIGYYEVDGRMSLKYERVPLDARFKDSAEMRTMFLNYQNELKQLYINGKFSDIAAKKHPSGYSYVGSQVCNDCHDEEYEIWEFGADGDGGPHFRATLGLTKPEQDNGFARVWLQRHFDPECISCHVTGWNPQNRYPFETGYFDLDKDTHLHGSGCENCHGPGSAHVAAENGDIDVSEEQKTKLANEMRLTLKQARDGHCMKCHDLDNSPEFLKPGAFDKFWAKIKH